MPGSLIPVRSKIVDEKGMLTPEWIRYLVTLEAKTGQSLTPIGQINDTTQVVGRSEGIGTTVQNLTPTGELNTDNLIDGTGLPLSGGKRGQVALDVNNRLANSFRDNTLNVSKCPIAPTVLSNAGGAATSISVAATTFQFGPNQISYNSGSVDPGVQGTFFVYAKDPTFAGGAVTFLFSTNPQAQTSDDGIVNFGKIITSAVASTGGGNTGGTTPGGEGGFGFNQG